MVGCSTYPRDKVGDILDVSAPAGDFRRLRLPASPGSRRVGRHDSPVLAEHSAPTLPRRQVMVAHAGPYRSRSCASPDGHRLDNSTLTSGISIGSRRHLLLPRPYGSCRGRAGPAHTPGECLARISWPPKQAEQVSAIPRTYRTLPRRQTSGALAAGPQVCTVPANPVTNSARAGDADG